MAEKLIVDCTVSDLFGVLFGALALIGTLVLLVIAIMYVVREEQHNEKIKRRDLVNEIVKEIEKRRYKL